MPIPVIVPIIAIGCAFTAPVLGMAAAGGNPGAPEVQNPNGLSEWIDRTFGFNPEQRGKPQFDYMEKVDDKGDGVKEELPSERMHVDEGAGEGMYMGPARSSDPAPRGTDAAKYNAAYYDSRDYGYDGSARSGPFAERTYPPPALSAGRDVESMVM